MLFSGYAEVTESYDAEQDKYVIEVNVRNKVFGPIFGYKGSFDVEYISVSDAEIPLHVRPIREELRE